MNIFLMEKQLIMGPGPMLLHPKSEVEINLPSRNLFEHPLINPNHLKGKEEIHKLIEACKSIENIC